MGAIARPARFVPIGHWRARAAIGLSDFFRWSQNRRGFWRISKQARRFAQHLLAGHEVPVRYFEGFLWIDPGRRLDRWIFYGGVYEHGTVHIIRRASASGCSFVDVGANVGDHTVAAALARRTPTQRFVAFEPDPRIVGVLQQNLEANNLLSFVDAFPCALAAEPSIGALDTQTDPDASHLTGHDSTSSVQVPIRRLDDVLDDTFPANVLMKIDVEGAEPQVLDGARRFLARRPEIVLIVEHNPETLARAGYDRLEVIDRVANLGFKVWRIDEATMRLSPIDPGSQGFCNVLAARTVPPFCN